MMSAIGGCTTPVAALKPLKQTPELNPSATRSPKSAYNPQ